MARMIHKSTYIKDKKIKLSLKVLVFVILMIVSFVVGKLFLQKLTNLFSIIAIIFAFVCAMFAVRLIIVWPFKDSDSANYKQLKELPNKFCVMNGMLLTSDLYRAYFEHIIIGHRKVYFVTLKDLDDKRQYKYNQVINKIYDQLDINYGHKLIIGEKQFHNILSKIKTQNDDSITKGQKEMIQTLKNYSM